MDIRRLATVSFPWSCLPLLRVAFFGHVDSTYNVISYGSDQAVLDQVDTRPTLATVGSAKSVFVHTYFCYRSRH